MLAQILNRFDFLEPGNLWFFLPTLLVFGVLQGWLQTRSDTPRLGPWRKRLSLSLRVLLLSVLLAILADFAALRGESRLAVMVCLDRSASLGPTRQQWMLDWVREAFRRLDFEDQAGIVVFGEQAAVETALQKNPEVTNPKSPVNSDFTNIASALRLSQACFPARSRGAILLLTDGQQNREDLSEEALLAKSAKIPILTVHCPPRPSQGEALIDSVVAPASVQQKRPFLVRAVLQSQVKQAAKVMLQVAGRVLETRSLTLSKGRQIIEFPVTMKQSGWPIFKVTLEAEADENSRNNVASAVTEVIGQSRVLLLDRNPTKLRILARLLRQNGFIVTLGQASKLPSEQTELASFDAIVLSDIPALAWSPDQMRALRHYVKDLGGGLVMLGGHESFGLGGYYKTPIEEVLPVECDLRNKDDAPELSILYCLDTSGSMGQVSNGLPRLELAREGVRRTACLVYEQDQIGLMGFHSDCYWALPFQNSVTGLDLERALDRLELGGATAIHNALKGALETLTKQPTELKHLVLLTDGQSTDQGDYEALLSVIRGAKISVSTIGLGEGIDEEFLRYIASGSHGRFFHARDAAELPRIFTKEALTGARTLLVEKSFEPQRLSPIDWFPGDLDGELPSLHGFVLSTAKPAAEILLSSTAGKRGKTDGPVLIRWRCGLGKSVALTSEIGGKWGQDWQNWGSLPRFWLRLMNWVCRDRLSGGDLALKIDGHEVLIDFRDQEPSRHEGFAGELTELQARVIPPAGGSAVAPLQLEAVGPRHYLGRFKTSQPGVYLVTVSQNRHGTFQQLARGGVDFAYPEEFRFLKSRPGLLKQIADSTNGKVLNLEEAPPKDLFELDFPVETLSQSVWEWLIVLAVVLWVLDIAVRRVNLVQVFSNLLWQESREHDLQLVEVLISNKGRVRTRTRTQMEQGKLLLKFSRASQVGSAGFEGGSQASQQKAALRVKAPKLPEKRVEDPAVMTSALLAAKRRARKKK